MKKLLLGLVAISLVSFGLKTAEAAFEDGWELTGGFETSYSYDFLNPALVGGATPGNVSSNGAAAGAFSTTPFHTRHNSFDFNRAELALEKTINDWAKFRLDMDYGQDVAVDTLGGVAQQAYLELTAPVGNGLTFKVGRFVTIMGYEVIETFSNWNVGHSMAHGYTIPYAHQGILMTYPVNDMFSFALGVVNDPTGGLAADDNDMKGFLYQLAFTPSDMWNFSIQGGLGWDTAGSDTGPTYIVDAILNYMPNENWTVGLNVDWRDTKGVFGLTDRLASNLYVHYANDMYGATFRGEWFNDDNGVVTGNANQDIYAGTVTGHVYMGDGLEFRPEVRFNYADRAFFLNKNGTAKKWDAVFTTALLYKF